MCPADASLQGKEMLALVRAVVSARDGCAHVVSEALFVWFLYFFPLVLTQLSAAQSRLVLRPVTFRHGDVS